MKVCDICRKTSVAALLLTANDGEQGFDLCPKHYEGLMIFLTEKDLYETIPELELKRDPAVDVKAIRKVHSAPKKGSVSQSVVQHAVKSAKHKME